MSLLFCDSFDHYDAADVLTKWTEWSVDGTNVSLPAGRTGNGIRFGDPNNGLRKTLAAGQSELVVGAAIRFASAPLGSFGGHVIFSFYSTAGSEFALSLNSDRTLRLYSIDVGNTLAGQGTSVLATNTWYYLELRILADGSTGTTAVRVDGAAEAGLTLTGYNTLPQSGANYTKVQISGDANLQQLDGQNFQADDLYVANVSGAHNNDFLGDVTVKTLLPTGAGATTGWTPDSGSNYARVNEAAADGDTSFISTGTLNTVDSYGFANLPGDVNAVKAVVHNHWAKKTGGGDRSIAGVTRLSGTDYVAGNQSLTASYRDYQTVMETRPSDSATWTPGDVDGAEFGVKVTV